MNLDRVFEIYHAVLQFLFAGNCDFCGRYLTATDHRRLCQHCLLVLSDKRREFNSRLRCGICAHPLDIPTTKSASSIKAKNRKNVYDRKKICPACIETPLKVKAGNALFSNTGLAQRFCYEYKFKKHPSYAHLLAKWIVDDYSDFFSKYDAIIVVALGSRGRFERGFCQVTEVVKMVSNLLSIPFFSPIKRLGFSSQHTLGKYQRKESLASQFFYREKDKGIFDGKKVLIVDDICSSGATINYFVQLIKENNRPKSIGAFFFARTILQAYKSQDEF